MRKYFGTDGIRRIANTELSPELVYKVAKAGAYVLSKHTDKAPTILIGRDTRLSGTLIESAMVAGFLSYGANVKLLGVMPTPAVAYLTRKLNADASVVISASHNTFEFNGIKYFSNKGMKIPDELEEEIEEVMESGKLDELTAVKDKIGVSEVRTDLLDEYVYFFRKHFDDNIEKYNRPDFKVVIDTANGATYQVADKVFKTLGINHVIINNHPDGININHHCGSTHLDGLKKYVVENKLSLGVAYDGDGDRCLAVDEKGNMAEETPFAGLFVKKADPEVLKDLDARGLLYDAPKFEHSYPHCWRCDTPLIYYARESWFIKMTAVKEDLIANNNTINWIPESIGKGRFGDWLENVQDWGISRNRYWGTPLNIWECECGHMHSVGSIEELKEMSDNCPDDIELHRPYIDAVTIKCPKCGKEMHRVPEVIDCWFDSGSMPFAQHHYPFENKELFERQFPADFISEAVDQTRGWFYSLLAISTLLFNKAPYKNVIVLGHVQDENGQKMSKSKGNAVDPFDALEKYGADAIRWYFYVNSAPWLPNRFHGKAVVEGQRKFMGTLWNTYAFFVLYANIDQFDATKYELEYNKLSVMDKWLLSKMNTMVKTVDTNLGNYRIPEAARALQEFVDDMSNWYVRRSRERFWAKGMEQDKINAYMTLYTSLVTISKVAAPMIPFMTEDIYQNLVRSIDKDAPESIHLCDFPVANKEWIDKDLEANMDHLLNVVVMGRACRNTANIKNRQPIAAMYIKAPYELSEYFTAIIADELNVKEVKFTDNIENFISYSFKPQLKTVGPKYGKLLNGIRKTLSELDGNKAMAELRANGELKLDIDGNEVVLSEGDLLIETAQMEGYVTESDNDIAVVLDTNLTPELIEEGFVREIISKIQTMRKEAGFEVMDKIQVYVKDNKVIEDIMKAHAEEIQAEVLAEKLLTDTAQGYVKSWNINSQEVTLGVEKMN